jgi:hypothetical protein
MVPSVVVVGSIGLPTSINILTVPCISVVTSILISIYNLVAAAVSLIPITEYYSMDSEGFITTVVAQAVAGNVGIYLLKFLATRAIMTVTKTIIYPVHMGLTGYSSCRTSNSLPIPSSSFIWFQFNR